MGKEKTLSVARFPLSVLQCPLCRALFAVRRAEQTTRYERRTMHNGNATDNG